MIKHLNIFIYIYYSSIQFNRTPQPKTQSQEGENSKFHSVWLYKFCDSCTSEQTLAHGNNKIEKKAKNKGRRQAKKVLKYSVTYLEKNTIVLKKKYIQKDVQIEYTTLSDVPLRAVMFSIHLPPLSNEAKYH